ncbi:Uma2 family endonuclease [bacterium]|nr:Uma2 family endonuclease [bacterium]
MSAARQFVLLSVQEYLETERNSPVKHEYLGGVVYAMSGARNVHNLVATNISAALWSQLRGQPCRTFNSDTKIRIRLPGQTRFYYPDASVVCRPNPPQEVYQDEPAVIVEVLSESTRRTDLGEKKDAYLSIPSLAVYLLVETSTPALVAFRRTDHGFVREVWEGLDATLPLPEIKVELPLTEIYDGVEFLED